MTASPLARAEAAPRLIVIMPGRNVARTLAATLAGIPPGLAERVVLVDNASKDGTADVAESLGLHVVRHPVDRGYGGSLKTCFRTALGLGADWILELHPDNQYDPRYIPDLVAAAAASPTFGVVLGSRFMPPQAALAGGMPLYKYISNRVLTRLNGWLLGRPLSEFHSGYRIYNARLLEQVAYRDNSDDFVFSFEILAQSIAAGYRVIEVAAFSRYHDHASSTPLLGSLRYGLATLEVSLAYRLGRYRDLARAVHPATRS